MVGAGSVVREDIPDYYIAFGNPARVYPACRPPILDYSPIRQVAAFEAWLGPEDKYFDELLGLKIRKETRLPRQRLGIMVLCCAH